MIPRKNSMIVGASLLVLFVVVFSGCGKEETPSPPAAATVAATRKPIQKQNSSVTTRPAVQEQYDFTGKKDPFRSYVVVAKTKLPLPPISNKHLPIQQYEVNQFKILGIITGLAENRAMVQDPTGKSYVVREGALIGPHNGLVKKIMPAYIEVSEQYREDSGKIKTRVVRLTLPRKE